MDGNGRWASQQKLPRAAGHRAGAKSVTRIIEHCSELGIKVLTLFAFSLENRQRPTAEVQFLMKLMQESLQRHSLRLHEQNIQLRVIGDRRYLSEGLRSEIEKAETLMYNNHGLVLIVALNYSGRWDIVQAVEKILNKCSATSSFASVETELTQHLCLSDLPSPDLFIRTSGEQRISNFMLWQLAYSELYFTERYWPDFTPDELDQAIQFYQCRQRRFGLTSEQVEAKDA